MLQYFHYPETFHLEDGSVLPELRIAYTTYGSLNAAKTNVVWICHALTASSDPADWWEGMVGRHGVISPDQYFIICANIVGSCYGTTGPLSDSPAGGTPYFHAFPKITIRDMVQAHILLRKHLGIDELFLLAGGSMGGYQALEWALTEKELIRNLFLLATSAAESAWGIAIHTAQRMAIEADGTWESNTTAAGLKGLKAARAMGMITYRNYQLIGKQQTDTDHSKLDDFRVSSYLKYQGEKLVNRFNAFSYWYLSKAMDTHNIARKRAAGTSEVLQQILQPVLLIGISSDILCPPQEQRYLAAHLQHCRYEEIDSPYGHDGFLVESERIGGHLKSWLDRL